MVYGMEYEPPKYRCQKHGEIDSLVMQVNITPQGQSMQSFKYCMYCYNEFLARNIHQVEDVK